MMSESPCGELSVHLTFLSSRGLEDAPISDINGLSYQTKQLTRVASKKEIRNLLGATGRTAHLAAAAVATEPALPLT